MGCGASAGSAAAKCSAGDQREVRTQSSSSEASKLDGVGIAPPAGQKEGSSCTTSKPTPVYNIATVSRGVSGASVGNMAAHAGRSDTSNLTNSAERNGAKPGQQRFETPVQSIAASDGICAVEEETQDHVMQREFLRAASQLSESELREFLVDHIKTELTRIRGLPKEQRPHAFRMLAAEWHPDKCPAIAGLATEMFQMLQEQKSNYM
mmetsp:Transcript_51855/g.91103  ORF Transcript_51855/g.91103 Transcript_51855/m.91103 type:complete len:208 (+) Transcript_51855:98-721(+)